MTAITRRQFLRLVAAAGTAGATAKLGLAARKWQEAVSETRILMGTIVNLTAVGPDQTLAAGAVGACFKQMAALVDIFNRHDPRSQVSLLNREGRLAEPAAPLVDVLRTANALSVNSNGAFDVTVKPLLDLYQRESRPATTAVTAARKLITYQGLNVTPDRIQLAEAGMGVTLDGIAKGYIVDAAADTLRAHGFENILVEAGGDLVASGRKDPRTAWEVQVQAPRRHLTSDRLTLSEQAVATSGDYNNTFTDDFSEHHIIDPRMGRSPAALSSATVLAPTACMADALSTTLLILGPEAGLDLVARLPQIEALLVTKAGESFYTPGWQRSLTIRESPL